MVRIEVLAGGEVYVIHSNNTAYYLLSPQELQDELFRKYVLLHATEVGATIPEVGTRHAYNIYYIHDGHLEHQKFSHEFISAALRLDAYYNAIMSDINLGDMK